LGASAGAVDRGLGHCKEFFGMNRCISQQGVIY